MASDPTCRPPDLNENEFHFHLDSYLPGTDNPPTSDHHRGARDAETRSALGCFGGRYQQEIREEDTLCAAAYPPMRDRPSQTTTQLHSTQLVGFRSISAPSLEYCGRGPPIRFRPASALEGEYVIEGGVWADPVIVYLSKLIQFVLRLREGRKRIARRPGSGSQRRGHTESFSEP